MPRKAGKSGAVKGDTITIRVPPRMKFALELLSRSKETSISSLVLNAVVPYIESETDTLTVTRKTEGSNEQLYIPDRAWDISVIDRTIKLAMLQPNLLTPDEEAAWKVVHEDQRYWEDRFKTEPKFKLIREEWIQIIEKARSILEQKKEL